MQNEDSKKGAPLEQHRDYVKDRAAQIKRMTYPRWSEERMKEEKAALAQERKLDRTVAPLTAGDGEMTMGQAMELVQKRLESPMVKKAKKAIKARWDRGLQRGIALVTVPTIGE